MTVWLYAASPQYANARETLALAQRHGVLWRSFYAERLPAQAIPNVGALRPGDTLYLGYRHAGQIVLLGRMRIRLADQPLSVSPVFTQIPEAAAAEYVAAEYKLDPVVQAIIGIAVEDIEPLKGMLPSRGRLTLTRIPQESQASSAGARHAPAATHEKPSSEVQPAQRRPAAEGRRQVFVGVDVGGRPEKGYDLCFMVWRGDRAVSTSYLRAPHSLPLPATSELRPAVAANDLAHVAVLTYPTVLWSARQLWRLIAEHVGTDLGGIFIDSPSAFSRNALGHGRLTEKQRVPGVTFQSTPSVSCGQEHGGDWGWLVYGMIAFAACLHRGAVSAHAWDEALASGLSEQSLSDEIVIRECFPTATIEYLRGRRRSHEVQGMLSTVSELSRESQLVRKYLTDGIRGRKPKKSSLADRADSLIAALSSLPYAASGFNEHMLRPDGIATWRGGVANAETIEGAIVVPG